MAVKKIEEEPTQVGTGAIASINNIIMRIIAVFAASGLSVIGAGAVVSKNIPSYAIAVGSPIKVIKYRFKEDVIKRLLETKWWDKSSDELHMKIENYLNIDS